ncbi:MAG: Dabb family protein [Flavobacteriaceae bacterium]
MKYQVAVSLSIVLLCSALSCTDRPTAHENARLKAQVDSLKTLMVSKHSGEVSHLVHLVFFKTRNEVSAQTLATQLKRLKGIGEVEALSVGSFRDLGDPRAFGEYNLVVSMLFKDSTSYRLYQEHPLHLKIKEETRELLAAPPISYDYHNK